MMTVGMPASSGQAFPRLHQRSRSTSCSRRLRRGRTDRPHASSRCGSSRPWSNPSALRHPGRAGREEDIGEVGDGLGFDGPDPLAPNGCIPVHRHDREALGQALRQGAKGERGQPARLTSWTRRLSGCAVSRGTQGTPAMKQPSMAAKASTERGRKIATGPAALTARPRRTVATSSAR